MTTMVPARDPRARSLADLLGSCADALRGRDNAMGFAPARSVVVVVVDGLGLAALRARSAYARTLAAAAEPLWSGFPTTTAAALTTITTGTLPGRHGLVGYSVLDPAHDRVVKQLSGWDDRLDPASWQRMPTIFEQLALESVATFAIGPARYASSGLTKAILRGADYRSAESVDARFSVARDILASGQPSLSYLYVPELDMTSHRLGWQSDAWADALETVDGQLRRLVETLRDDQALVVTADHGIVDIAAQKHVIYGRKRELTDGVRHRAGEPRCLQLHVEPTLSDTGRARLRDAWQQAEAHRSWVVTREEAVAAGWFGEVAPEVLPRIGDLLIAARKGIAYYASENDPGRGMVGQHGSWSSDETQVPLARFGAFADA